MPSQETGLYYLQSRYYNPEMGRFINADAITATGQGIIGNNMFAYCNNNPIVFSDTSGFDRTISLGNHDILTYALMAYGAAAFAATSSPRANPVATTVSKPTQMGNDVYSVYFLKLLDGLNDEIVYVGRVKTVNKDARMRYHNLKGRELVFCIDGLNYGECRFIEQVGMIWCHTINPNEELHNQIRGISPSNAKRFDYFQAGIDLGNNGGWLDQFFPISYFSNQTENFILNGL